MAQLTGSGSPSSSEVVLTTVTCGLVSSGGPGSLLSFSFCHLIPILSPCAESALRSSEVDEDLDSKAVVEVREKRGRNIKGVGYIDLVKDCMAEGLGAGCDGERKWGITFGPTDI